MEGEFFLVTYTILSQAAIGLIVMMFVGNRLGGDSPGETPRCGRAFLVAAALTAAAMAVSAVHLGSPLRAMNSLFNVGSSWLSREILLTNAFFLCVLWGALAVRRRMNYQLPLLLGALCGLACVLCQAAIYANTVFPAWGFGHAYVTFFGATFVIGSFLAALFRRGGASGANEQKALAASLAVVAAAVVAEAGFYSIFGGLLSGAGAAGSASLTLLSGYNALLATRWVCGALALIGLIFYLRRGGVGASLIVWAALATAGEILGRIVFYGIGAAIGL